MLHAFKTTVFIGFALAATAVGIYGAFADAIFDGLVAPLVSGPTYILLLVGCMMLFSFVLLPTAGWVRRLKSVALSIAMIVFITPFSPLLVLYDYPGDRLHFLRDLPQYSEQVESLPHNGKRFAEFNWGGMLFASSGMVYDETDEIALPSGKQSPQWRARMKETELTCGGDGPIGPVVPMARHYYFTSFGC